METFSNSELGCRRMCARKHKYKYIDLKVKSGEAEPLWFGSLVHAALELFWSDKELGLKELIKELHDWADANPYDRDSTYLMIQAEVMITGYWERWGSNRDEYTDRQAELVFQADIENPHAKFTGKIDAIARHIKTGDLHLIEHKTTAMDIADPAAMYWQRLSLDNQITGYQFAMMERFGEPITIIYDVLRKPTSKKPKMKKRVVKKKTETQEDFEIRKADVMESNQEFADRIREDYLAKLPELCVRRHIHRTQKNRDEWKQEVNDTINQILESKRSFDPVFTKNDTACTMYNTLCEYFLVCCGMGNLDSDSFRSKGAKHEELQA